MKFLTFLASTMLIVLISQHSTMGLPVDTDSTTITDDRRHEGKDAHCKEGFELVGDICEPVAATTVSDASSSSDSTTIVTHPKEDVKTSETTTVSDASSSSDSTTIVTRPQEDVTTSETTTLNVETTSDDINYMNCPGGLKRGDDGFCPEFKPINRTESVNPKGLLKPDGSCPDNYVKVKEQCLYVKPKSNGSSFGSNSYLPTSSTDDLHNSDLVPVESGNVCPRGTEYFSNGLCRKLPASTKGDFDANGNRVCPDDYDSVNGICIHKGVNNDATTIGDQQSTTPIEASADHHETSESPSDVGTDDHHAATFAPKSDRM